MRALARRTGGLAVALLLGAVLGVSTAAAAPVNFGSAVTQFMCVSCHEPLNQVNSPQAISEKATLQSLIARGLSMGQIKSAMEAQYGPEVLARPPASGFNLTIYILPPAVFLGGLALLAYTLPKWRRRSREAANSRLPAAAPLHPDDARRLGEELDGFV
jgi:cytochrome c-type biogenesis protein CcmH/NrfF